ncbi:MAG: pyridoxamine 5'-phosphate oxidase family protein [Coleofasciculus sp. B1-GNL1-01]|uniref:pyridoxamine 5'-phosphate oxidase family protein n=1 Tax=Coleofasciculus sp. B1-GNL1-01 TaxID=3068484 RepID=UPI0032F81EEE
MEQSNAQEGAIMELATAANAWINTKDSKNPEVIEKARYIINHNYYCVLSTCSPDGLPWGSPVFFAYEYNRGYHIYWCSAVDAKHSQNLYHNYGRVAITIFDSSVAEGTGSGLYFYGSASELDVDQIERVVKLMANRAGKEINRTVTDYLDGSPRRLYHFQPDQVWITGERLPVGNQLVDTKIQISLSEF